VGASAPRAVTALPLRSVADGPPHYSGELHAGVQLARTRPAPEGRTGRLDAVRAVFAPLPVDEAVAERYGELLAIARRTGRTAKATDLLIAATAAATGRTLYTLDRAQASLARAAGLPVSGARV
jgi:predicted nucleic acid-binding protein